MQSGDGSSINEHIIFHNSKDQYLSDYKYLPHYDRHFNLYVGFRPDSSFALTD